MRAALKTLPGIVMVLAGICVLNLAAPEDWRRYPAGIVIVLVGLGMEWLGISGHYDTPRVRAGCGAALVLAGVAMITLLPHAGIAGIVNLLAYPVLFYGAFMAREAIRKSLKLQTGR